MQKTEGKDCTGCGYLDEDAAGEKFCGYHGDYIKDIPLDYLRDCPEKTKD